jgi:hypothetical protein
MFSIADLLSSRIPSLAIVANGGMISKKEVRGVCLVCAGVLAA